MPPIIPQEKLILREPPMGVRGWLWVGGMWAVLLIALAPMLAVVAQGFTGGSAPEPASSVLAPAPAALIVIKSVGIAALIATLAVIVALAPAWVLASERCARWLPAACMIPLVLPTYLGYAGLNVLRQPTTWLGDFIARQPTWVPLFIDQALGILGMTLWVWPLAAMVMSAGFAKVDAEQLDALMLEGAGRRRRAWHVIQQCRSSLTAAWLLVMVLMLGSGVPLHLAQFDTLAIRLWADLGTMPAAQVWPRAWPLVLIAMLTAYWVATQLTGATRDPAAPRRIASARLSKALVVGVLVLSVLLPLALFVKGLKHWSSVGTFWASSGPLVVQSMLRSLVIGGLIVGLAMLMWWGLSQTHGLSKRSRRLATLLLGALAFWALMPGVLVGSAVKVVFSCGWWDAASWLSQLRDGFEDSGGSLAFAQVLRFGVIGVIAGWALDSVEPRELRDLRLGGGSSTARGWWLGCVKPRVLALLGVGLTGAALAMQEIEAAVIVAPPGGQSLAARVLEHLHYNAMEQLMAAGVNLLGVALLLAVLAAGLSGGMGWIGARRAEPNSIESE